MWRAVLVAVAALLSLQLKVAEASSSSSAAAAAAETPSRSQSHGQAVIEWLRSRDGGYFNSDKVVIRNGGMYAARDIAEGEVVMVVPACALLGPDPDDDIDDSWECGTARRLVHEYAALGEEASEYWPYVRYVFEDFPHADLPTAWSREGKDLVATIVGEGLEPQDFGYGSYDLFCGEDSYDYEEGELELLEAAWRIVMSRGWHHIMVPVFDMVNHRNGAWFSLERSPVDGHGGKTNLDVDGDFRIVAVRDVAAGSQLHNSYNECNDVTCRGALLDEPIKLSYVTSHIFSDYGFVEQYPRRFAFDTGSDHDHYELGMVFEIESNNKEGEGGGEQVTWSTGPPSAQQVAWLEVQWERLKEDTFARSIAERARNLRPSEGGTAMEYYEAIVGALEVALQSEWAVRHRKKEHIAEERNGGADEL